MRIRFIAIACICFIIFTCTKCYQSKDRIQTHESKMTILTGGDEWIFSPSWDLDHRFLIFHTLVVKNEKGELEGRLAESWEHSPDYRTWTIHLRKDIKWHDGVPFTAHDVKFTMDLYSHPDVLLEVPGNFTLTVLDDCTYTITFHKSSYTSMNPLSTWRLYYPKHILEKLDPGGFWEWEFWIHPVGNGPYRFVSYEPKTKIELEANPDYFRGKPKIERIVLKFGGSTPLTELLSGDVDFANVNPIDIPKLAEDPRFLMYYKIYPQVVMVIYWNHNFPPFDDPKVRRALTMAINRRELYQMLNLPKEIPVYDMIFTEEQLWRNELLEPLPYDPEMAKKLLDETGWCDRDGDGIRERSEHEFRFTAFTVVLAGIMDEHKAAVYIQDKLLRVGVKMEIQPMAEGLPSRLSSGDFEAIIWRFPSQLFGIHGQLRILGKDSLIGYQNPRVIELLNLVKNTFDPDERDRIYRELLAIVQADLPLTFLHPLLTSTVAHRRIRGISNLPWINIYQFIENLWIDEE